MSGARVKADSYFEKPNQVGTFFAIATQIKETYRKAVSSASGAGA
jgi:hypothetical protein